VGIRTLKLVLPASTVLRMTTVTTRPIGVSATLIWSPVKLSEPWESWYEKVGLPVMVVVA